MLCDLFNSQPKAIMKSSFLLFICCFIFCGIAYAEEITAKQLVRDADHYRGFPNASFQFQLETVNYVPDKKTQFNRLSVYVRETDSLVKFLAPARDKGKAMLFKDRDLWFHAPKTKRLIRIAPIQRLLGNSSNGDVAGTRFDNDYSATLVGKETIGEESTFVLDLKAVDKKVTYARLKYWIAESDHRPVKSEHYAISGKLLKVVHYEKFVETEEGRKLAFLTILDPIKPQQRTTMAYSHWEKANLSKSMFQKNYLKRLK